MPAKHQTFVTNNMGHSASSISPGFYGRNGNVFHTTRSAPVCTATPTRHFPGGKYLKCDLYGMPFPNLDAAHKAMCEHGYTEVYYSRRSVPLPLFAKNEGIRQECRFDALYRLWAHRERLAWRDPRLKNPDWYWRQFAIFEELKFLAKKVTIFHPVAAAWTSAHRRSNIKVQ